VNVICQCAVSLTSGDNRRNVTVLVQKGVPQKLLLDTDVLKDLGFHLLGPAIGRACMTDLLGTGSWQMQLFCLDKDSSEPIYCRRAMFQLDTAVLQR